SVGLAVIDDGGRGQEVGAVQTAGLVAEQVIAAKFVGGKQPRPFGGDRLEPEWIDLVADGAAGGDIIAAAAVERVGALSADQDVAAGAALQDIIPFAADQDVRRGRRIDIDRVVAGSAIDDQPSTHHAGGGHRVVPFAGEYGHARREPGADDLV